MTIVKCMYLSTLIDEKISSQYRVSNKLNNEVYKMCHVHRVLKWFASNTPMDL